MKLGETHSPQERDREKRKEGNTRKEETIIKRRRKIERKKIKRKIQERKR